MSNEIEETFGAYTTHDSDDDFVIPDAILAGDVDFGDDDDSEDA